MYDTTDYVVAWLSMLFILAPITPAIVAVVVWAWKRRQKRKRLQGDIHD